MFNLKKPTIGDFVKNQGLSVEDGEIKKTPSQEELDQKAIDDLKKMTEDPNYDPSTEKSYFGEEQYEFEEIGINPDDYSNEDTLYSYLTREMDVAKLNDKDRDDLMGQLEKRVIRFKSESLKSAPKYTDFEKKSLQTVLENHLRKKKQKVGEKELSKNQVDEALEEFKLNFPEDFVKMIHNKVIEGGSKWKKEVFKGKDLLVSYYPSVENPLIKYITDDNLKKGEKIDKLLVNTSVKKNGKVYRNQDGPILVFCSQPKKKKKKT